MRRMNSNMELEPERELEITSVIVDRQFPQQVMGRRHGLLVGLRIGSEVVVMGYCAPQQEEEEGGDLLSCELFVRCHYPAGCSVIGWWIWNTEALSDDHILRLGGSRDPSKPVCGRGQSVVLVPSEGGVVKCFKCQEEGGQLRLSEVEIMKREVGVMVETGLVTFRLRTAVGLTLPVDADDRVISEKVSKLRQSIDGVLLLPRLNRLLCRKRKGMEEMTVAAITGLKSPESLELLQSLSTSSAPVAPEITLTPLTLPAVSITLTLDVLGIFPKDASLDAVSNLMKEKISCQLDLVKSKMQQKMCSIAVHHFSVPSQHCPVTVVYPHTPLHASTPTSDEELSSSRRLLHQQLCLPLSQPFLRIINLHWGQQPPGPYLIKPHVGVKTVRVSGGQLAFVEGHYSYHHYMQDGFNDDGWGCAYRSLQTLWSWFQLQGYTSLPPPSHHEIQQALVSVQDKEKSFLGSKEWIGSYEVSTVLNQLLGVESKLHHCPSGADMASSGRVLLRHFTSQGTPVMIGGGVLAHTIVGVDFNELTGEVKFLIVDPHYTGRDDLRLVQEKGWCGWKTTQFWDTQAHYNMCLPQRPEGI